MNILVAIIVVGNIIIIHELDILLANGLLLRSFPLVWDLGCRFVKVEPDILLRFFPWWIPMMLEKTNLEDEGAFEERGSARFSVIFVEPLTLF